MRNIIYLFIIFFIVTIHRPGFAQDFSLDDILKTPYVSNLTTSKVSSTLYFTLNEAGKRNLYRATAPQYTLEKLTHFDEDDGQEITSLSLSKDEQWLVFVRGGDHGANSAAESVNPASFTEAQNIELFSISLQTRKVTSLGEGDFPVIHPNADQVSFLRAYQVWVAPIDGSEKSKRLFQAKGSVRSMQWSPDGQKLVFSSRRGDHAFIGLFEQDKNRIRWLAPSFHIDGTPQWSPDGKKVAFIRQPGSGGALDSLLVKRHQPWAIVVADLASNQIDTLWEAPPTLRGSFPRWSGGANLNWPRQNNIVFLSYQDGWPHLYTLSLTNTAVRQLTQGAFSVDQISYSSDGNALVFSANAGSEKEDIDRKHIGIVHLDNGPMRLLTQGAGIEYYPLFTNNDTEIAALSSTATRPLLPTVYPLEHPDQPILVGQSLLKDFDYKQLVVPQQVRFASEDGLNVHGQLFVPKQMKTDVPGLIYIHGGPRRQMYLGWHAIDYYFYDYAVIQHLVNQGIAVLSVNYRMGTGYGFDFQNPTHAGSLGASEYQDIAAAGRWLAQKKGIDPALIGIFGGSYGGYLTAMALGKNSNLFTVGVDIHGVHNRTKSLDADAFPPDFDEAARIAWESSPSRWVTGWRSPALIIHSDDDQNVAFSQSMDLVNRLKSQDVAIEYLVIPDDTHHWMLFDNLMTVKHATVDYLKRHLLKNKK